MWAIAGPAAATSAAVAATSRGVAVVGRQGGGGGEGGRGGGRGGRGGGGGGDAVRLVRGSKPAVLRLGKEDLPRLLPWSGCGERLAVEVGDLEACTARVAVSLFACALMYGTSIELASVAGFYWAWAPILSTALPNLLLRARYGYAGVWSAQVLQVEVLNPPKFVPDDRADLLGKVFNRLPTVPSTLQLEIGDGSPATFRMKIPLSDDMPEVETGDRVELMVVSDEPSLSRFKVLRDLYLPDKQAWISEEPCVERTSFEQLQKSLNSPAQSSTSKGGDRGRRTQPLPEEDTFTFAESNISKGRDSGRRAQQSLEEDILTPAQSNTSKGDSGRGNQPLPEEDTFAPAQSNTSKGGDSGRRSQQLLEENTLSRDRASWEKALRQEKQSGSRPTDFDYITGVQEEKKYKRRARELNDDDLYL